MTTNTSPDQDSSAPDNMWVAMGRGALNSCPRCARGKLFARFLRATPKCSSCGQDWTLHQADDFPPYLSILVTGHVLAPFALIAAMHDDIPSWISTSLILITATIMAIGLLQPAKGAVIALQWWLGMHGFKSNPGRPQTASSNDDGFTLVELSIVMIIIGLLIGGTLGGVKIVENAEVSKTIRDLKQFESSALTFKDTYGRFPGDITNPSTRLPGCTAPPCSRGGNGDRIIGPGGHINVTPLAVTDEGYTFWHHLAAAGFIGGIKNTDDMAFGQGQPASPLGGGYRMERFLNNGNLVVVGNLVTGHILNVSRVPSSAVAGLASEYRSIDCRQIAKIDRKIDNGMPITGKISADQYCSSTPVTIDSPYIETRSNGIMRYVFRF